jgi:hypothetical protein
MTMPPPGAVPQVPAPTPFDTGNTLLGEQPAMFFTAVIDTPLGQRLAATIRTASTTLTVFLSGADAKNWAAQFSRDAGAMSGAGLVVANGQVPKLPPKG